MPRASVGSLTGCASSLAATDDGRRRPVTTIPVSILLDNVRSLYNIGAFFRTADAVGAERLYLSGLTACPPHRGITKTALGAEQAVSWERCEDPLKTVDVLRGRGCEIAAIETTLRAVDLFDWQPRFPICVVLGHEVDGVRPALLERCDTHVRIPMLGRKHSLNVASAGAVVLFELLRKHRSMAGA